MKAFLFKVTLVSGLAVLQSGIGYNVNEALMDACDVMAQCGELNEDEVQSVELVNTEEERHHA